MTSGKGKTMSRYDDSDYDDMSYELDEFLKSHKPSELLKLVQNAVEWCEEAALDAIKDLPSTQVEIVRCDECKHKCGEHDEYICCDKNVWHEPDWFCADGKKRGE